MTRPRSTDRKKVSPAREKENGRLARLLAHREMELAAAQRMSEVFSQQIKLQDLMAQALQIALDVVDAENGSILLADAEKGQLVFYHSIGSQPVPPGTAVPWDEGIAGTVFRTGQPEIVPDAQTDTRHFKKVDEVTGSVTHDMITIPLKQWEGAPIGVMQVMNKRGETFLNEEDLSILTIISALAAVAIEHTKLVEAAKLAEVAQMMGDITHDIKNLLMPVVCGAGILQTEINDLLTQLPDIHVTRAKASRDLCNEVIAMLKEDARRIQDRVREIADAVKGLSSPLEFSACEISAIVSNVFRSLGVLAQERSITLATENLELLPLIVVDSRRIYNALYNLINNAIPEVPFGGAVTVRGTMLSHENAIVISVIDTGRGMAPEIRDRLFTKSVVSTKPGGTGLGTKIVKDVVDAHGGRVWVESELEKGTSVHVLLPLSPVGIQHLEPARLRAQEA